MKVFRNFVLVVWLSAVAVQLSGAVTFEQLQKKFGLPQDAQKMMQYYIDRKVAKKPLSAGGFYVELYKYLSSSPLTPGQYFMMRNNVLKAMAFLALGTDDQAALQNKMNEIEAELGKVRLLVNQEEIDINDLK